MDLVTLALAKSYTDEVVEGNGGAGSAAQVQADWNQSDETAVDFIKNRPFYDDIIINEYSLTFSENPSNGWYHTTQAAVIKDQLKSCVIRINNVDYNCKVYGGNIGSVSEDFLVDVESSSVFVYMGYKGGGWGYSIYSKKYFDNAAIILTFNNIKQIDEKFIPNVFLKADNLEYVSLPQADWDDDVEISNSYIRNRPFYMRYNQTSTILTEEITSSGIAQYARTTDLNLAYSLFVNHSNSETKYFINEQEAIINSAKPNNYYGTFEIILSCDNNASYIISIDKNKGEISFVQYANNEPTTLKISVQLAEPIIKTLSEYYIPDTIARKSEIKTSNWNAQEGEDGFIENRTHYASIETVFSGVITWEEGMAFLTDFIPIIGSTYQITYNGISYECIAEVYENEGVVGIAVGNKAAIGGEDTGEPFIIVYTSSEGAAIMDCDGEDLSETVTIKTEVVKKLDSKYLDLDLDSPVFYVDVVLSTNDGVTTGTTEVTPNQLTAAYNSGKMVMLRYNYQVVSDGTATSYYTAFLNLVNTFGATYSGIRSIIVEATFIGNAPAPYLKVLLNQETGDTGFNAPFAVTLYET